MPEIYHSVWTAIEEPPTAFAKTVVSSLRNKMINNKEMFATSEFLNNLTATETTVIRKIMVDGENPKISAELFLKVMYFMAQNSDFGLEEIYDLDQQKRVVVENC